MNRSGVEAHCRSPEEKLWRQSTTTWPKGWVWVCVTVPASEARPRSLAQPLTSSLRVKLSSKSLINTGGYYSRCLHTFSSSHLSIFLIFCKGSSLKMVVWLTLPAGSALLSPTWSSCWYWPGSGFSLCSWASSKTTSACSVSHKCFCKQWRHGFALFFYSASCLNDHLTHNLKKQHCPTYTMWYLATQVFSTVHSEIFIPAPCLGTQHTSQFCLFFCIWGNSGESNWFSNKLRETLPKPAIPYDNTTMRKCCTHASLYLKG